MRDKQPLFYKKWIKSANSRPTIGLTIYGLDNSINISLWRGVIDAAKAYDVNVISFMARDLDSPLGFQAQANVLFDLISPDRLDGLLIWTVPLINIAGPTGVQRIFEHFRSLPIVAIEEGAPEDFPRVVVDSYQPVHDIVNHLVEAHGCRRIAFVRGPDETHVGARQRYQGYLDALIEHNLPIDLNLVSPPTGGLWIPEIGKAAISLFLDERGVAFDAVVGVNDAIAIEAMHALQARGIHVPNDVAVVGFDDLDAGTYIIPPLTTVSLQSYEQGKKAVETLVALLAGEEVPNQVNVSLPLVIRQSCGCISPNVAQAPAGLVAVANKQFEVLTQEQQNRILAPMRQAVSTATTGLQPRWDHELVNAFFRELTGETNSVFLFTLDMILRQVVAVNSPVAEWQNVISAFRRNTLPFLANNGTLHRAEDLWRQAQIMIGETNMLVQQGQSLQDERQSQVLNEIGSALITTFDVTELMDVLAQELPRLDIPGCFVSLYKDPHQPSGQAKLILAYDERGRLEPQAGDGIFAAPLLMPPEILQKERRYSYVVEALYFREEQLGFALFEEGPHRGRIYYILREQLSSALKGALLVYQLEEQTMKAEKAREAVEKSSHGLRESEARLRALIDNLPFDFWAMDNNLRYTMQNTASLRNFGIIVGKRVEELGLPPELEIQWIEEDLRVLEGEILSMEYEADVKGEIRIYQNIIAPVKVDAVTIGIVGVGMDITERKRVENQVRKLNTELEQRVRKRTAQLEAANQELRQSEQRYRIVFENSPVSIWEADFSQVKGYFDDLRALGITDFRAYFESHPEATAHCAELIKIVDVNRATLTMLETTDKQTLITGLPQILANTSLRAFREEIITLAEGGYEFGNYEESHQTLKGNIRSVIVRISIAPGYEHSLGKILVSCVDVTDRKRAEEEIHRLNQELEQRVLDRTIQLEAANKELEAFAYSVSHDLRAPVRHIGGFLELLREHLDPPLDAEGLRYLGIIADAAKRMGLMIDALLSFSRMSRSQMSETKIDLGELVQNVIREFELEVTGRDVEWQISPLPKIIGDRTMLQMVLENLISNALKFTRARDKAKIEVGWLQANEPEIVIFVRDNGVGFEMAYADKLFGVFQRLHRADEFEGTGIGLANVRRIIERHGGRTWAESEPDRGATFYFSLPQTEE